MHIPFKAFLVLLLVASVCSTHDSCSCRGRAGSCCSCQGMVPRPQQRVVGAQGISSSFRSTGDSCSCGHTVVQPAVPPKPLCNTNINLAAPAAQGPCHEKTIRAPESLQGPNTHPNQIYGTRADNILPSPADAVSLSLAYQMARSARRQIPEEQIQYGPRVQPMIVRTLAQRTRNGVAEERLWSLNRAVVELKTADARASENSDDDDDIDDEDKDSSKTENHGPGYLTYGQIGYCPEQQSTKTFNIRVPTLQLAEGCTNNARTAGDKTCGYKPGKVEMIDRHLLSDTERGGLEDCLE